MELPSGSNISGRREPAGKVITFGQSKGAAGSLAWKQNLYFRVFEKVGGSVPFVAFEYSFFPPAPTGK